MPEAVKDNDINGLYQKLNAIAQTGLTFSKDVFDTERYESLRHIATQLMASRFDIDPETLHHVTESGYATPKTDVRAFILRDGKLLMVREAEDGLWSLPGG